MSFSRIGMARLGMFAVILCVTTSCRAANEPAKVEAPPVFSVVPVDILAVAAVTDLEGVVQRATNVRKRLHLPDRGPTLLAMLKGVLGEHVDWKASAAVGVVAFDDAPPPGLAPILFLPVTDFDKFIKDKDGTKLDGDVWEIGLGANKLLAGKKANFAVCVPMGVKDQLERVLTAKKHLAQAAAEHRLVTDDKNDFVGVVTPAGISKFSGLAKLGIAIAQKQIEVSGDPNAEAAAAVFGVYKTMFDSAAKEVTFLTVSSALEGRGGMRAGAQLLFKKDGAWAKMVAKGQAAPGNLLAGLPEGDYVFAGGMSWSAAWMDSMLDMSLHMMKAMPNLYGKLTDKQLAEMRTAWKGMMNVKAMSLVMGTPEKDKPWMSTMAATIGVDDAKQYMKNYAKAMKDYVKLMPKPGPLMPKYAMRQIEVGADKRLGVEFEMELALPPGAETQGFEVLFGKDKKFSAYIAAADDHTVVMTYDSKERLEALIKGVSNPGLAADKNIKATSKLLLDKPLMALYVSPSGIFQTVRYFANMFKPGADAEIPAFPPTPPIGFAARASSDRLKFDAVVPDALITAAADYAKKLNEGAR